MQTPTILTLGAAGIEVPRVVTETIGDVTSRADFGIARFLIVRAEVPTLKAGTLAWSASRDGGVTWTPLLGFVMLTGAEPQLTGGATAATYTGGSALTLGLYLPGTKLRAVPGTSQVAVAASLTSNHSNALADVTLTAKATGAAGNSIRVTYADPGGAEAALVVSVFGTDITVTLGRTSNALASTAAQVEAAINAHAGASALVTATKEGAGSGICNALARANLANGWDEPTVRLYFGT